MKRLVIVLLGWNVVLATAAAPNLPAAPVVHRRTLLGTVAHCGVFFPERVREVVRQLWWVGARDEHASDDEAQAIPLEYLNKTVEKLRQELGQRGVVFREVPRDRDGDDFLRQEIEAGRFRVIKSQPVLGATVYLSPQEILDLMPLFEPLRARRDTNRALGYWQFYAVKKALADEFGYGVYVDPYFELLPADNRAIATTNFTQRRLTMVPELNFEYFMHEVVHVLLQPVLLAENPEQKLAELEVKWAPMLGQDNFQVMRESLKFVLNLPLDEALEPWVPQIVHEYVANSVQASLVAERLRLNRALDAVRRRVIRGINRYAVYPIIEAILSIPLGRRSSGQRALLQQAMRAHLAGEPMDKFNLEWQQRPLK